MKLRDIKNLPVFYQDKAELIGSVEKAAIGDDYKLAYIVVDIPQRVPGMIIRNDFQLTEGSIILHDLESIKSYAHGEELSIYEQKLGDKVFDSEGKELGVVSDFIVATESKEVWGVEVSAGIIPDLLEGRSEISLKDLKWKSNKGIILQNEGSG
jgi:sporulation protein YlmC with PRC-barrel domain